jgi:O-antigen ligase
VSQASALPRHEEFAAFLLPLAILVPVLHIAHATGLRNTLAMVIAVWALSLLARRRERPPLAGPMLAWLLIGAASSLWSPDAGIALKSVLTDIVMPLGAFCAAYLASQQPHGFRDLTAAVFVSIGIIAAFTIIAFAADLTEQLPVELRGGPLYYYPGPGVASTLAIYAVPFALLLAGDASRLARYLGYGGLICILLVGLGTTNRMFWPTLAAALATFHLWQLPRYTGRQRYWVGLAILGIAVLAGAMVHHLNAFRDPRDNAIEIRLQGWREWSAIADDALLHGHGLGKKNIRKVRGDRLSEGLVSLDQHLQSHGHNFFLNVVLQTGLLGLAALCILFGCLLREAYHARDPARLRASAALATLVIAMLAKNVTDDFMDQAVAIAFWIYAGLLLGRLRATAG